MRDFKAMSPLVKKAYEIAREAHAGQVDKAGADYILHPMTVASNVGDDENAVIVALLHDVCEDTDVTIGELAEVFPQPVIEALRAMTHDKDTPYMEYVAQVKKNPIARAVKIADMEHNMDLSRIPNPSQKDLERLEKKYKPAYEFITED